MFVIALEGPVNSLVGHGFFLLYLVDSLGSSPCRIACLLFGSHVDGVGTVLCSGCSSGLRIYLSVLAYWALARRAHVVAFCAPLWPGCGASWCPLALLLWLVGELASSVPVCCWARVVGGPLARSWLHLRSGQLSCRSWPFPLLPCGLSWEFALTHRVPPSFQLCICNAFVTTSEG